jgi:hypothetical protein
MHGAGTCGAVIRQVSAVTRHCGAARTGCRGMTAQAATPAVAASTRMSATAASSSTRVAATATAASTRVAAARAAHGA